MEFNIFKKFLLEINVENDNIEQMSNFFSGISYFRIYEKVETIEGLKEVFDIFLNCKNEKVVKKAAALIK